MRKLFIRLLLLLVLSPLGIHAQNVLVAGAVVGNGLYPDLGSAFTAINGGAQTGASILVSIVGNTTEPTTATLNQGTWLYLYITPSGGTTRTITGNIAGPLISFNSADRVAIDGLNSGGNALTISNTNNTTASTIQFINDARAVAVQKCTILGSNVGTASGTILIGTGTGTGGGNDSIAINQCIIDAAGANLPVNGVYSLGTTTPGQENSSVTIAANSIANYFSATTISAGVLAAAGNSTWTVQGNRFFQSATRTYTTANTHSMINISSGDNHLITANILGFATAAGTGVYTMTSTVATRLIGINLAVGTGTASSVQGNTITAISLGTSSGASTTNGIICGINVTAGNVNIGTVTPNIIGGTTGANLITATPTTAGGAVMGIHSASTGTISIQNNTIGGITSTGLTASLSGGVTGINISGIATSMTITGNTIGNTTADNIRGGQLGLTTGSSSVVGINLAAIPVAATVSLNVIRNLSSYGTGINGFARGIVTVVAPASTGSATISDNQVTNLISNANNASYGNGLTSVSGIVVAGGTNMVVHKNTVNTLSNINTGTGGTVVVGIGHGNATNSIISNNTVDGLSNANTSTTVTTPGTVVGILVRSGTNGVTVRNNMISLGTGATTNTSFVGIMGSHGSTPDPTLVGVYNNTVNIAGTAASGALPSFGIARTDWGGVARMVPYDIRNNLVTNSRSGGTGQHFAIGNNYGAAATATGWPANASNNNVLNANAATVGWWTTARAFCDWKSAAASDGNSFSGVPVTYVNAATNLHLNMGTTPNAMESAGQTIAGVATDFDADTRPGPVGSVNGGATAPDIGADEFDGVIGDFAGPAIVYIPLPFICTTVDRTLTATISDMSGVPTTGSLQPRLYYRKNAGTWQTSQGVLTSGTGLNGTWDFLLSAAAMGGVTLGDVISYYVIAQDIAGVVNMNTNPVGCFVASDVNTVTTHLTPTNTYAIGGNMAGTYTVGLTGNYATVGAAATAYNSGCLTGPVVFNLIDAAYPTETYPITFAQNPYSSATNTLLVRPTLANTVLAGSSATMLINLSGADYVTLDGSIGNTPNTCCPYSAASRDLTLQNTSTNLNSAVVWLGTTGAGDPVTNCTVQNMVILGNSPSTTLLGIGAGASTIGLSGTNNHNLAMVNNDIRACQVGIYSSGASAATKNQGINISQNLLNSLTPNNIGFEGIYVAFTDNVNVSCNQIDGIVSGGTLDLAAINVGFGVVNGLSTTLAGIADGVSNVTINNNVIGAVAQSGTFSSAGIAVGNMVTGTATISNNMISGVISNGTAGDFSAAIMIGGGTATINVDHNTVAMQGTITGASAATQTSACLAVTSPTALPALNVRNNIFSNTQMGNAGATLRHTAVALRYGTPYTGMLSDNNDLYVGGAGPGTYVVGITGSITGTSRTTLLDWQTETGQDAASISVAPAYTSATDLHLLAAGNQPLSNTGMALPSVTEDIDCAARSATTPDIGADEFLAVCVTAAVGALIPGDSSSCTTDSLVLAALSYSTGAGSTYSWETSPFGLNSWTPVVGAVNPDFFNTGAVTTPTDFRLVVTCATNASTVYSDTLTFFVGDSTAPLAACQPQSVTLDTNGLAVVPAANYDDGSSDNCTAPGALVFSIGQDTFDCAAVGVNTLVFTVTDAAGNTSTCMTNLMVTASVFTATISSPLLVNGQNISCNGGNDGTATATPDGGCPAYSYLWSDGQTVPTAVGLDAGTYTVTVTDASGQADTLTITLTEPAAALANTTSSTQESCVPGLDGTATIAVTGGSPGYAYLWSTNGTTATITGLAAGNYTVTVTDTTGCITTGTVTVNASTTPATPVITQNGNDLECASTGVTFQWFLNGSPISGATGATTPITGPGDYTVTVTNAFGCSTTSLVFTVVGMTTGNFDNALQVWPNPARGTAYVRLAGSDVQPCTLIVTDLRGRVLLREHDLDLSAARELDLRGFAAGTYLVETQQGGLRRTLRLVVQ